MKEVKTIFVTHPVAPERKAELRSNGYRIVDARFAKEGDTIYSEDGGNDIGDVTVDDVIDMINQLDKSNADLWTSDNKPKVEVFQNLFNVSVTATLRNKAISKMEEDT